MACLKDFHWWPRAWVTETGSSPAMGEISKHRVLKNVRRSADGLTLVVDYNGVIYTAVIDSNLSEDFLILLRHIMLKKKGEPMEAVENCDIGFDHLTKQML